MQKTFSPSTNNQNTGQNELANYWQTRWEKHQTGWDIGYPSPAITNYLDTIENKDIAILIPGCGNAYEAEYLFRKGFSNVTLIDIAPAVTSMLKDKFLYDPQIKVLNEDFFQHQGEYDLILEQTFFCAIQPELRKKYVEKTHQLLNENGKIVGLLFNRTFEVSPPYGGSREKYMELFDSHFIIHTMEDCLNSIPPRKGTELFIHMERK